MLGPTVSVTFLLTETVLQDYSSRRKCLFKLTVCRDLIPYLAGCKAGWHEGMTEEIQFITMQAGKTEQTESLEDKVNLM